MTFREQLKIIVPTYNGHNLSAVFEAENIKNSIDHIVKLNTLVGIDEEEGTLLFSLAKKFNHLPQILNNEMIQFLRDLYMGAPQTETFDERGTESNVAKFESAIMKLNENDCFSEYSDTLKQIIDYRPNSRET